MEKPTEISPYTSFLTTEVLNTMETIPSNVLSVFKFLSNKDPIFTEAPEIAYKLLYLLHFHSQTDPKLFNLTKRISKICAQTGVFSNITLVEDYKLITADGEVMINRVALESFVQYFRVATRFENKGIFKLQYYSNGAIELLKSYIYTRSDIEPTEGFRELFELLILSEKMEYKPLHNHLKRIIKNKAESISTFHEMIIVREIMESRQDEIRDYWMEFYFIALKAASHDETCWEQMDLLIDLSLFNFYLTGPKWQKSFIRICRSVADSLSKGVNTEKKFLSFYKLINRLNPLSGKEKETMIFDTIFSLYTSQGIDLRRKDGKLIIPAQHLNLIIQNTPVSALIKIHELVGSIVIRTKNEHDRSQFKFATVLHQNKMQLIKNVTIEVDATLSDNELNFLRRYLPDTKFTVLVNLSDTLCSELDDRITLSDYTQDFITKINNFKKLPSNISFILQSTHKEIRVVDVSCYEDWQSLGLFLHDNRCIKELEIHNSDCDERKDVVKLLKKYRTCTSDGTYFDGRHFIRFD
ncbi:MAG: hypothetical protein K940chlam3_00224 [Chlamydiae bacterium]|nr:hypothetical protein [Chlamydiota bacterium]